MSRNETPEEKRERITRETQEWRRDSWVTQKPHKPWSRANRISVSLNTPFPWVRWETTG